MAESSDATYAGEIVDTHHHLWDMRRGHYPWLQEQYDPERFFLGPYKGLCRDYLPATYRADVKAYHVRATVHVEAERARDEQVQETTWIQELHRACGMPAVSVGHVFFTQPDRDEVLAAHMRSPLIRGVRSKPVVARDWRQSVRGDAGTMQDDNWLAGLASLERHRLSWDARIPFWHLAELADAVRQVPGVPVALNHAGLPLDRSEEGLRSWRVGLEAVARQEHVFLKLSEFGLGRGRWDDRLIQRIVQECVALFGFDRVMFGSNLPVSSLSASFDMIVRTIVAALPAASERDLRKLFATNGRRFYRIEDAGTPSG